MPLRLLVKEEFTTTIDNELREFDKHERITDPKVIGKVLATHPDFVLREEVPNTHTHDPDSTVPGKVPHRAPKPELS